MQTTITKAIVATESQNGTPYVNKNWQPFRMLHIQLADWTWASKYYNIDDKVPEIVEWEEYDVNVVQNGQYFNITSIYRPVTVEDFIEAAKQYGFGLDESQTWKMAKELEKCSTIAECEDVVNEYMNSGALSQIWYELGSNVL